MKRFAILTFAAVLTAGCAGDDGGPTAPSPMAEVAASPDTANTLGTPTPIGQFDSDEDAWTGPDLPHHNHAGPSVMDAPDCASNARVVEQRSFGQVIPYDGKQLVGVIYVEWDWNASLCSGGARYRTIFEVTWDGHGTGNFDRETFAGYASHQPTTYYVQEYVGDDGGLGSYTVRFGTQVYHNDHWNKPTVHGDGFSFTM